MAIRMEMVEEKQTVKCNGEPLAVDLGKMHASYIAAIMRKGVQRYFNDMLASMEPGTKLAAYRDELVKAHSGEALPEKARKASGTATKVDPIAKRTLAEAKADLLVRFAVANKLPADKVHKIVALVAHPKVKEYFHEKDGKFTWDDSKVKEFIERELAGGGRDYLQEAVDFFARVPETGTIDF